MSTHLSLTEKEGEMIAIGASIAAGCQPCTRFHFRAARAAGADDEEIRQAVRVALDVRSRATSIMAELAEENLGEILKSGAGHPAETLRAGPLVALGAAFAANCATQVETYLIAAWRIGATESQISTALKIAQAVKAMAGKKTGAAVDRLADAAANCAADCGCQDNTRQLPPGLTVGCCSEGERGVPA